MNILEALSLTRSGHTVRPVSWRKSCPSQWALVKEREGVEMVVLSRLEPTHTGYVGVERIAVVSILRVEGGLGIMPVDELLGDWEVVEDNS